MFFYVAQSTESTEETVRKVQCGGSPIDKDGNLVLVKGSAVPGIELP
jgi:hypothetical protein